jgi:hypothetical protein
LAGEWALALVVIVDATIEYHRSESQKLKADPADGFLAPRAVRLMQWLSSANHGFGGGLKRAWYEG